MISAYIQYLKELGF